MRIHGDIKIKRRDTIYSQNNYKKYEPELSEDFGHICGYCGKSEMVSTKGFEIDHFVPNDIDSSLKTDYNNLVYCCFTCNRKKSNKWPTNNKELPNNGKEGFVDPATEEYDKHLERATKGDIIAITPVGTYMKEKVFKFHLRPIKEIWKYMQILHKLDQLDEKQSNLMEEEKNYYITLRQECNELHKLLFEKKE